MIEFLDLGMQPTANGFLTHEQFADEQLYPLRVGYNQDTCLVSLSTIRPKTELFNEHYAYRSAGSQTMLKHFAETADYLRKYISNSEARYYAIGSPMHILEIGSNDCAFMRNFTPEEVIGVEPCPHRAALADQLGYTCYCKWWQPSTAADIMKKHGKFKVVYAANCICHIENLSDAFEAVAVLLEHDGVFVFEDPSLESTVSINAYDQVYDEHAHIFSVVALDNWLKQSDILLQVVHVEQLPTHGGSNRIYVSWIGHHRSQSVDDAIARERAAGLDDLETFRNFARNVEQSRTDLVGLLTDINRKGDIVVGYGATSKSTVVYNYCGIGPELIECVFDTTLEKQGKFTPGTHIPILPPFEDGLDPRTVKYAFLGAWNYLDEIRLKEDKFTKGGGKFITHVPSVRVL